MVRVAGARARKVNITAAGRLSPDQVSVYRYLSRTRGATVASPEQALQSGDKSATLEAAGDVKETYAGLFVQSG